MRRNGAERVLLVVGTLIGSAALLVGYVYDTVADSGEFADRAAAAYSTPEVSEQMTSAVVDQLVEAEPELVAVQPLLESVVDGVFRSNLATTAVRAGVEDLHRTVIVGDDDTVLVVLADFLLVAKTQLTALDAEAGALIPDELTDALIAIETEPAMVDAVQLVDNIGLAALLLPLLALGAFVGSIWLADRPSSGLVRVGLATVCAALLAMVAEVLVRAFVTGAGSDADDVARAVWDAYADNLSTWILATAAVGAAVAAIAWFGVGDAQYTDRLTQLRRLVRHRTARRERVLWGLAAMTVGVFIMLEWRRMVQFVVLLSAVALIVVGLREIVAATAPGLVEGASEDDVARDELRDGRPARRGRWVSTALLGGIGVVALVALWNGGGGSNSDQATGTDECNQSAELCEQSVSEVVFAATHNSHAAADEGFAFGYHRSGIAAQLDAGIRALLIDVYFGRDVDGVVITDRAPMSAEERDVLVAEMGEAAVRSAEATADRADEGGVERELFLCHALCEVGATRLADTLQTIRGFLTANPGDVLLIIVQDEGPLPEDMALAFGEADLTSHLYAHSEGEPWPTLGDLVDADTRLIVFAENVSGDLDWYHDAFTEIQDTPFKFEGIEEFSCDLNRGEPDSPLFLVNHWLSPVSPTAAMEANEASVLLDRLEACETERGQLPNMIAVDFFEEGDLVETVARLNSGG